MNEKLIVRTSLATSIVAAIYKHADLSPIKD